MEPLFTRNMTKNGVRSTHHIDDVRENDVVFIVCFIHLGVLFW